MDYESTIELMTAPTLTAMLMTAIKLLSVEDNYLEMTKQEIFNLIYRYSFEECGQ